MAAMAIFIGDRPFQLYEEPSAMNLIYSKLGNKMGAEKANKLIYIYINQRVLDRNNSLFLGDPLEKTAEEQVQLEDILLDLL